MQMKMKTVVTYKMTGESKSHALTEYSVRDLKAFVDEPLERGGTNLAPSPTETMLGALVGCTNGSRIKLLTNMALRVRKWLLRSKPNLIDVA